MKPGIPTSIALSFLLFSSSCAPVLKPEQAKIAVPQKFRQEKKTGIKTVEKKYWENFQDAYLNELIEKGLTNNSDLKIATLRMQQDFANARMKAQKFFPDLYGVASYQRTRASLNTGQPIGQFGIPRDQNLYNIGLDFNYEIDLWGRIRSEYKAARSKGKASYYLSLQTEQQLISEIIRAYYTLRCSDFNRRVLQEIVEKSINQQNLIEVQYKSGWISLEPLLQQKNRTLIFQQQLEKSRLESVQSATALAILLNEHPSFFEPKLEPLSLNIPDLKIPEVMPSDWIRKRPDIRAAEEQLMGANAMNQAALAEFFPRFTFGTRFGVQSLQLSELFSKGSQFFGIGPGITVPIFNIGEILAHYRAQKIESQIQFEQYKKTVLGAFKEVENQLALFNDASTEWNQARSILDHSRQISTLEKKKQAAGLSEKTISLQKEIESQQSLLEAGKKKLSLIFSSVDLMRALGGGLD